MKKLIIFNMLIITLACNDCPKPDKIVYNNSDTTIIKEYHYSDSVFLNNTYHYKDSLIKEYHHYETIYDTLFYSDLMFPDKEHPHIMVQSMNVVNSILNYSIVNYDKPHENIIVQGVFNVVLNDSLHESYIWDTISLNHAQTYSSTINLSLNNASLYDLIISARYNDRIVDLMDVVYTE